MRKGKRPLKMTRIFYFGVFLQARSEAVLDWHEELIYLLVMSGSMNFRIVLFDIGGVLDEFTGTRVLLAWTANRLSFEEPGKPENKALKKTS